VSLEWLATNLLAVWLLPPLDLIVVIALGLALVPRRPRLGLVLAAAGLAVLAALSTPRVGDLLAATLEDGAPPLKAQRAKHAGARARRISWRKSWSGSSASRCAGAKRNRSTRSRMRACPLSSSPPPVSAG
jgi:hypothetical protein